MTVLLTKILSNRLERGSFSVLSFLNGICAATHHLIYRLDYLYDIALVTIGASGASMVIWHRRRRESGQFKRGELTGIAVRLFRIGCDVNDVLPG